MKKIIYLLIFFIMFCVSVYCATEGYTNVQIVSSVLALCYFIQAVSEEIKERINKK